MGNFYTFFEVGIFINFRSNDLNSYFGALKQNRSNSLSNISRFWFRENCASKKVCVQSIMSELIDKYQTQCFYVLYYVWKCLIFPEKCNQEM